MEGFIIADQSPNAVDISAIRNTNTKIIMRLPDENDRRIAGKSAALNDEQLDEIAKLPKGVAVVYQNDWIEPVLCKIRKFDDEEVPYKYYTETKFKNDNNIIVNSELLKFLLKGRVTENIEVDIDKLSKLLVKSNISTKNKIKINFLINEYAKTEKLSLWKVANFDKLSSLITEILDCNGYVENLANSVENFTVLTDELSTMIRNKTSDLNDEIVLSICQCLLKEFSKQGDENLEIYAAWRHEVDNGVIF